MNMPRPRGFARASRPDDASTDATDRGATLIEVLISIVLLGLAIAPMLTLLSVTVSASATERDHANAHAWLQIASDTLYGEERIDCGSQLAPAIIASYQSSVRSTSSPEGWDASLIEVVDVSFWDGDVYQTTCYAAENINLQLITLRVRNPDGEIVETVEIVKG